MPVSLLPTLPRPGTRDRVAVNPRWADRLRELGLTRFSDFIDLPGEIISGHADRHVVRVDRPGPDAVLKREHRTGWRSRLRNRLVGSLARREAIVLDELSRAGVPVPEWVAYGEAADGRAFLLLRRMRGYADLRTALALPGIDRRRLCERLGRALGRLHRAGYVAPDLSAKHVFVKPDTGQVTLIDWPRARRSTGESEQFHDLERLNSSVPTEWATTIERLRVLRSYELARRERQQPELGHRREDPKGKTLTLALSRARFDFGRLRSRRASTTESPRPSQRLRWLDGERLCVARPLWRTLEGRMPAWLVAASRQASAQPRLSCVPFGWLIQLPPAPTPTRMLATLTGRPAQSLAVRQAALAFMLQRRGVPITPVLAFGGRGDGSGFLLIQSPDEHRELGEYLALPRPRRSALIDRLGALMRTCHEAGIATVPADRLIVDGTTRPRLRLAIDGSLRRRKRLNQRQMTESLQALAEGLQLTRRGDIARLLRGYVGRRDLRYADLRLASRLLRLEGL